MNKRFEIGDVLLVYDDELADVETDEFGGDLKSIGFLALRTSDESSMLMTSLRSEVKMNDEPEEKWRPASFNADRVQTLENVVKAMEEFTAWYREQESSRG